MALRKLDKTFIPKNKEVKYLNKSFSEFRQSLIDFAKVYFPDTYTDFNESSPGMMFVEMASYVGDVLSYYIDTQFRENLIEYAQEEDNIITLAQSFGYKPKPSTASSTTLNVYQLCPAMDLSGDYAPDPKYLLRLDAGMILSAPQYGTSFRTNTIVDFTNPLDREVTVYAVDGLNKPLTYLIRKEVQVLAGTIKTATRAFTTPTKFSKITLPETNVLEILRVVDTQSNRWYEVDYLAQDLVFEDKLNLRAASSTESVSPYYILKVKRAPRRFVTRYNTDFYLELHFGSGVVDDLDTRVNLDPNKIASSEYQTLLASTALDPSDFLTTKSYGLSPANTELTITYVIGGGLNSNVPASAITKIDEVTVLNDISTLSSTERNLFFDAKASIAVSNPIAATGGKEKESIEEIKRNALAFFNAQNRLVTAEDYIVRCYAMPPKYGGVAKATVAREDQIVQITRASQEQAPVDGEFVPDPVGQNKVNLYVLGYNKDKKLVRLNADTKKNLRDYLENYRMLTDEINILDGFIVNIGVEFSIITYRNFNLNEVLARCIDAVKQFFDVSKWDLNQPIVTNDVLLEIAAVEGVQSVTSLKFFNRYGFKDGADYESNLYDLDSATEKGVIYPSADPCIFELRYPDRDIIGNATQ